MNGSHKFFIKGWIDYLKNRNASKDDTESINISIGLANDLREDLVEFYGAQVADSMWGSRLIRIVSPNPAWEVVNVTLKTPEEVQDVVFD